MCKCDFCKYSIIKHGKLECNANCSIQKLNGCKDAIEKMERHLQQNKSYSDISLGNELKVKWRKNETLD